MARLSIARPGGRLERGERAGFQQPRRGYAMLLMVIASIVISFGGLVIRSIEAADPWQINFYRSIAFMTAILLLLLFRYRGATGRQITAIGRDGILGGILLAGAGIAFLQSLTNTTVANTLFMMSAIPFFAAGLAWLLLKERIGRTTLAAMIFAALGIAVMLAEGVGAGSAYGNIMALVTAVCFGSYAVIVRRNRGVDMMPALLVTGVVIMITSTIARFGDLEISLHDLLLCILWGGVMSGVTNCLFIIATRHLIAAEVTLFMLLEFALGPIWVWIFAAETPSFWTLLGGALVISAVAIHTLLQLRTPGST